MRFVRDRRRIEMTWTWGLWRGPFAATWIGLLLASHGQADAPSHSAAIALVSLVAGVLLAALDALTARFPVIRSLAGGGPVTLTERLWLAVLVVGAGLAVLWVGPSHAGDHRGAGVLVMLTAAAAAAALPSAIAFPHRRAGIRS
jgi:hypothetical protein